MAFGKDNISDHLVWVSIGYTKKKKRLIQFFYAMILTRSLKFDFAIRIKHYYLYTIFRPRSAH